jgi:hypothetical protein
MAFLDWAREALLERGPHRLARRRRGSAGLTAAVEILEERLLLSAAGVEDLDGSAATHPSRVADDDRAVDAFGNEYVATGLPDPALGADTTGDFDATGTLLPLSQTFFLHSNPGATHTIYLDFDGHVTSGTTWNSAFTGGEAFSTPAFDFEGGISDFTNNELSRIQYIWQRVVEDFLPFDVNVTTQDPGAAALSKTGRNDAEWGIRVAIGGNSSDWYGASAGGVAYVGSFNWSSDAPVFVFTENLARAEKYTAEAISHEVGHSLGLNHDGTSSSSYYQGSGSGATGWAPIMGVGYYKELTTWSRGEYSGANNTEDDLVKITSNNGFGYRGDEYGNTAASAGSLAVSGTSAAGSGIIESASDVDVFSLTTAAGSVSFTVTPSNRGANLDVLAELYDSTGTLVASANPSSLLSASFSISVSAGTYYLHVSGVGKGSPASGGYSDYASIGAYRISGTVAEAPAGDIGGDYLYRGSATRVVQDGSSLTFVNEHGGSSVGHFLSSTQVVATGWGNLVGTISGDDIVWANGAIWTRGSLPSIGGDYVLNGGLARIVQSGVSLTFINEHGNSVAGRFLDATRVEATGWGNLIGTIDGNDIVWANGTRWAAPPNIAGNYVFNSRSTSVVQSGTTLSFVNEHGNTSSGVFVDATHVRATDWGNLVGTINGDRIEWANGTGWVRTTAAAAVVAASADFGSDAESSRRTPAASAIPQEFAVRNIRLDAIHDESPSIAVPASPSPRWEAAPIDVDEVFAAFDALQTSMYEGDDDSARDAAAVASNVDDLLDLVQDLISSRDALA